MRVKDLVEDAYKTAVQKGWWEQYAQYAAVPEKLLLIVSEISEATEVYRTVNSLNHIWEEQGKPEGFPIELADAVIRIADLCGALGIDLEKAIAMKMAYNQTRPYRHGNKRA